MSKGEMFMVAALTFAYTAWCLELYRRVVEKQNGPERPEPKIPLGQLKHLLK